jgi:hypothetical protein
VTSRLLFALLMLSAVIFSCQDEITNNYYLSTSGAVFGNVVPADSGTAILHGLSEFSTPIDVNGFFNFAQVNPGKYTLELRPQNHGRRQMKDVIVGTGVTNQFPGIVISTHPFPVYSISPQDGATGIYTGSSIRITSDEALDLDDLNNLTSFDPSVAGEWSSDVYYYDDYFYYDKVASGKSYTFRASSYLLPGTEYHMLINQSVHTESGTLDGDLQLTFTTRAFDAYFDFTENSRSGRVPRRGFRATINVYLCVSSDSLAKAVEFEPDISGTWYPSGYYNECETGLSRQYDFLATDLPLLPGTTYKVIVRGEPLGIVAIDSAKFQTEGYEVINVLPRNGYYGVPVDNQVLVIFNEPMDTVSARLALTVTRVGGEEVPGTYTWNAARTEMTYSHYEHLYTIGSYIIVVTTEAKTESGDNLDYGWESYFQVL